MGKEDRPQNEKDAAVEGTENFSSVHFPDSYSDDKKKKLYEGFKKYAEANPVIPSKPEDNEEELRIAREELLKKFLKEDSSKE